MRIPIYPWNLPQIPHTPPATSRQAQGKAARSPNRYNFRLPAPMTQNKLSVISACRNPHGLGLIWIFSENTESFTSVAVTFITSSGKFDVVGRLEPSFEVTHTQSKKKSARCNLFYFSISYIVWINWVTFLIVLAQFVVKCNCFVCGCVTTAPRSDCEPSRAINSIKSVWSNLFDFRDKNYTLFGFETIGLWWVLNQTC